MKIPSEKELDRIRREYPAGKILKLPTQKTSPNADKT